MGGSSGERSYEDLAATVSKLEADAGRRLVVQRDLIRAKGRVDVELARFKTIQTYVADALACPKDDAFLERTLEAVIEVFEFEVAAFCQPCDVPDCLRVIARFGLEGAPDTIPFSADWLGGEEAVILSGLEEGRPGWEGLALASAILCPFHDKKGGLAGVVLAGITSDRSDYYDPITPDDVSAFTVMVQQAAAIWNTRRLTAEVEHQNARLEAEIGRSLTTQQALVKTKGQVDQELQRFKSIQDFIAEALAVETVEVFYSTTLEAIIGAFELEVALFLRAEDAGRLKAVSSFGFDDPPDMLAYTDSWFDVPEARIVTGTDAVLRTWDGLGLDQAILCPFHDRNGGVAGAILAGITVSGMDYYDPIDPAQRAAFTVMVRQAGAISITRELNEEIQHRNRQLVSLTDSYSRFVPFQFLELLERQSIEDIEPGANASLDVSVLFLDIRGFTRLTEKLGPDPTFILLNEFLSLMEPLIAKDGGFINQYQGDAIMALFPGSADSALNCAKAMMRAGRDFNDRQRDAGADRIEFGIGINSGPLLLGAIGSENRLDSNVVGDTANLAARIESLTRLYGVGCILTDRTLERVGRIEDHHVRTLDAVVVKGREGGVDIFELMLEPRGGAEEFDTARAHYRAGRFAQGLLAFESYVDANPDDPAAALYLSRCRRFAEAPPDNWTGLSIIRHK